MSPQHTKQVKSGLVSCPGSLRNMHLAHSVGGNFSLWLVDPKLQLMWCDQLLSQDIQGIFTSQTSSWLVGIAAEQPQSLTLPVLPVDPGDGARQCECGKEGTHPT